MSALLKNKTDITAWLEFHQVKNYTLVIDEQYGHVVDVAGDVDLNNIKLNKIPIQFGKVSGSFYCANSGLTSLKGSPISVGGNCYFHYNNLTTLEGGPTSVDGRFSCSSNQLTSLEGSPASVGGIFNCSYNHLTSLLGGPASVGGDFFCYNNQLNSLLGGPESVGGEFHCSYNTALGEYQHITDFKVIKEKILSDTEKKALSTSLDNKLLKGYVLKI